MKRAGESSEEARQSLGEIQQLHSGCFGINQMGQHSSWEVLMIPKITQPYLAVFSSDEKKLSFFVLLARAEKI